MGQKLQDGKKVLFVSLNSPHPERPPDQTAGPSNLPFWILENHYRANMHKNFHLPGMLGNVCRKGRNSRKFQEIYIFKKRPNGLKAGI